MIIDRLLGRNTEWPHFDTDVRYDSPSDGQLSQHEQPADGNQLPDHSNEPKLEMLNPPTE